MDCLIRIKELLNERKWTMYQLAQKSSIPQSTLSNLFIRNNAPTVPTLEKICKAFGISMAEFFKQENNLCDEEQRLLTEWRRLTDKQKVTLLEFIKTVNN